MAGQLEGKVITITGAARGIGRACALAFAREGAKVVASTGADAAAGEETVRLIREAGGDAVFTLCEITDEASVEAMVKLALDTYGRIDGAFNNAGTGHGNYPMCEIPTDKFRRSVDIVLTGTWLCMKHIIPVMVAQGGGVIVNVASTTGMMAFPFSAGYAAAKAGLINLTATAAKEYGPKNVRVSALSPGPVETDMITRAVEANPAMRERIESMIPLGKIAQPEDVAELAVFMLSDKGHLISGANYALDGGQTA